MQKWSNLFNKNEHFEELNIRWIWMLFHKEMNKQCSEVISKYKPYKYCNKMLSGNKNSHEKKIIRTLWNWLSPQTFTGTECEFDHIPSASEKIKIGIKFILKTDGEDKWQQTCVVKWKNNFLQKRFTIETQGLLKTSSYLNIFFHQRNQQHSMHNRYLHVLSSCYEINGEWKKKKNFR